MEIKNRKSFNNLIKSLAEEIVEEDELDEITVTGNIDGYSTPFVFTGKNKKNKDKKKKVATNSTDFEIVKEALDDKDLKQIKILIRDVVANILRDIWLKRTTWK